MQKITQQGLEETIKRVLGFVKQVAYYENSNLVYVYKMGGMNISSYNKLEMLGLKLRYIEPTMVNSKLGLKISLEIL